jgi:hypothetical protein
MRKDSSLRLSFAIDLFTFHVITLLAPVYKPGFCFLVHLSSRLSLLVTTVFVATSAFVNTCR